MADPGKKTPRDAFVGRIVKDPKELPDAAVVQAFLGDAAEADHVRLYLNAELSDYLDVAESAVLHSEPLGKDVSPLGGHLVWVKRCAELTSGRAGGVSSRGRWLEGALAREQMPYAAAHQGGLQSLRTVVDPQCGIPQSRLIICSTRYSLSCPTRYLANCITRPWACDFQTIYNPDCWERPTLTGPCPTIVCPSIVDACPSAPGACDPWTVYRTPVLEQTPAFQQAPAFQQQAQAFAGGAAQPYAAVPAAGIQAQAGFGPSAVSPYCPVPVSRLVACPSQYVICNFPTRDFRCPLPSRNFNCPTVLACPSRVDACPSAPGGCDPWTIYQTTPVIQQTPVFQQTPAYQATPAYGTPAVNPGAGFGGGFGG